MTDEWSFPTYAIVVVATAVYLEQRCRALASQKGRSQSWCGVAATLGLAGIFLATVQRARDAPDPTVRACLWATAAVATLVLADSGSTALHAAA